jgi:hypothetical protein
MLADPFIGGGDRKVSKYSQRRRVKFSEKGIFVGGSKVLRISFHSLFVVSTIEANIRRSVLTEI